MVWITLILTIPVHFSKFRIRQISNEFTPIKTTYCFSDLYSDGVSEKISIDLNDTKQTKIIVRRNDKILNQSDLKYHPLENKNIYFGDYNNDKCEEIYVFTLFMDSIFLNIIDPIKSRATILSERFIDFRWKPQNSYEEPTIRPFALAQENSNTIKDLFFYINRGYSKHPRTVYKYIIDKDSLIKSPVSGATISGCQLCDIDNDSTSEIILDTQATGNLVDTFPYSDKYA